MRMSFVVLLLCAQFTSAEQPAAKHKILFNRFLVPEVQIMMADADGKNERALTPHSGGPVATEYAPSWSADGKWIVYTQERAASADIYRIHPDGTGYEQLTDDPAFDDQGSLSPDGKLLAFISTRGSGTANLWVLDIASRRYSAVTQGQAGNYRPA